MLNAAATRARDTLDHTYVALQSWNTNPADIRLPDVINTKRPQLTREQIVARYMKSIEGNPAIDIKKIPSIKSKNIPQVEFIQSKPSPSETLKREVDCERVILPWDGNAECLPNAFYDFRDYVEKTAAVKVDLMGIDPACACLPVLPTFFICSNDNLNAMYRGEYSWMFMRDTAYKLDYRNFSYLQESKACQWAHCPTAETEQMAINRQIDETINAAAAKFIGSTIYLNKTLLDDYLLWRKYNSKPNNFSYIVVSDRPNTESSGPSIGEIGGGIAAALTVAGMAFGAIRLVNYCRGRDGNVQPVADDDAPKLGHDLVELESATCDGDAGPSPTS